MRRSLITGGRDRADEDTLRAALLEHGPGVVVHGAARGADTIAAEVAAELGMVVEAHPVHPLAWRWSKAAGNDRNTHMVGFGADVCLAFPTSRSRGTRDCVCKAEAAGIPVHIYREVP